MILFKTNLLMLMPWLEFDQKLIYNAIKNLFLYYYINKIYKDDL